MASTSRPRQRTWTHGSASAVISPIVTASIRATARAMKWSRWRDGKTFTSVRGAAESSNRTHLRWWVRIPTSDYWPSEPGKAGHRSPLLPDLYHGPELPQAVNDPFHKLTIQSRGVRYGRHKLALRGCDLPVLAACLGDEAGPLCEPEEILCGAVACPNDLPSRHAAGRG